MKEKRKFHRVAYQATGSIAIEETKTLEVTVADLSLYGALLYTNQPHNLKIGSNAFVNIKLAPELSINFKAKVARINNIPNTNTWAIGVTCISIALEDITNLKTLIAMNSADPTLLERELTELIQ